MDKNLKITQRVVAGLDELGDDVGQYIEARKKQARHAADEAVEYVINHAMVLARVVVVRWAKNRLSQVLPAGWGGI